MAARDTTDAAYERDLTVPVATPSANGARAS
jgi:hypothetical protein